MKARDVMIPLVEFLRPETTLKDAVRTLRVAKRGEHRRGVKGLPVLDEDGRLVGLLTLGDIIKAAFPYYMTLIDVGEFTWDGMLEQMASKLSEKPVSSVMASAVVAVREDAPLMECIDHMLKNNVTRLPVLDEEERVVGMVYEMDIFFAITDAMQKALDKNRGGEEG